MTWLPPATLVGALLLMALPAPGRAQARDAPVYRCGSSYQAQPCTGGAPVDVADPRSDAQRQEAAQVRQREAALARQMAAERRAAERQAARQGEPANVGPAPGTARAAPVAKPPPKPTSKPTPKPPRRPERPDRPDRPKGQKNSA